MGPIRQFLRSVGRGRTASPTESERPGSPAGQASADAETKVCPECARQVEVSAASCRFCRHEFEPPPSAHL